jgi:hypothetical protein
LGAVDRMGKGESKFVANRDWVNHLAPGLRKRHATYVGPARTR